MRNPWFQCQPVVQSTANPLVKARPNREKAVPEPQRREMALGEQNHEEYSGQRPGR